MWKEKRGQVPYDAAMTLVPSAKLAFKQQKLLQFFSMVIHSGCFFIKSNDVVPILAKI